MNIRSNDIFKDIDFHNLRCNIKNTYEPTAKAPHVLIELSNTEYKRHKANIIYVEHPSFASNKEIYYSKITYGNNIKAKTYYTNTDGFKINQKSIFIQKIKKRYLFIAASKQECISVFPELLVSSSTTNTDPSGKVVLLVCIYDDTAKTSCPPWNYNDFASIKSCKPNILSGSSHHGSVGYYASFGNKGSFKKVMNSSVGQYVNKKKSDLIRQVQIDEVASRYDNKISLEIKVCCNIMGRLLPNIRSVISPVIDTAFEIQNEVGDINLQPVSSSKNGCWQTSVCINAQTSDFHIEKDCTYTLISIPRQEYFKSTTKKDAFNFIFKLSKTEMVNIELVPSLSFIFSGLFLTHRQNKNTENNTSNDVFFNIASYGNKRLFHHLRKSINIK